MGDKWEGFIGALAHPFLQSTVVSASAGSTRSLSSPSRLVWLAVSAYLKSYCLESPLNVTCRTDIVQVYLLLVILRHARTLSKRPLKTILLTPTSKLPELIPGRSSFATCPFPPFHQSNARPLSAIYISGPEDVGTGLLESDYASRSSLSSSRYPTTSFSGGTRSSSDTVRSSNSLRLPPLPPPHSPQSDRFTRPPPRAHACVRRELRRGREVS